MTARRVETTIRAFVQPLGDMSAADGCLVRKAYQVRLKAQAPYSHFLVGAALSAQDDPVHGRIFVGCNVERASYSQATHAEQNAIDSMVAKLGPRKIRTMAVIGGSANTPINLCTVSLTDLPKLTMDQIGAPSCGHCLQCIWENCMGDVDVRLIWNLPNGLIAKTTIGSAFPMRFGPKDLGITL